MFLQIAISIIKIASFKWYPSFSSSNLSVISCNSLESNCSSFHSSHPVCTYRMFKKFTTPLLSRKILTRGKNDYNKGFRILLVQFNDDLDHDLELDFKELFKIKLIFSNTNTYFSRNWKKRKMLRSDISLNFWKFDLKNIRNSVMFTFSDCLTSNDVK